MVVQFIIGRSMLGLLAWLAACAFAALHANESLRIEVSETSGLRRYGYPVVAEFRASWSATEATKLRLRDGERTISTQFTLLEPSQPDQAALWAADFSIDLAPLERRMLRIEFDATGPQPEAKPGLQVESHDGKLLVRSKSLAYIVPENLRGLLSAMRVSGDDWLAAPAAGLVVTTRDGREVALQVPQADSPSDSWRIVKPGPLAVALDRGWTQSLDEQRQLTCRVRLDFPLGKSWVHVDCAVDDPSDAVSELSGTLRLRLEATGKQPVLADVGAGGWTYAVLQPGESLVYRAGGSASGALGSGSVILNWRVDRMRAGVTEAFARPTDSPRPIAVSGWAHLSDAKRATAIAMHDFANKNDSIELAADGQVKLARAYGPRAESIQTPKRLAFWLHFVSAPPQWGAATSPQSMLAPPTVRVVSASETEGTFRLRQTPAPHDHGSH